MFRNSKRFCILCPRASIVSNVSHRGTSRLIMFNLIFIIKTSYLAIIYVWCHELKHPISHGASCHCNMYNMASGNPETTMRFHANFVTGMS